jgi:hypothetical protein
MSVYLAWYILERNKHVLAHYLCGIFSILDPKQQVIVVSTFVTNHIQIMLFHYCTPHEIQRSIRPNESSHLQQVHTISEPPGGRLATFGNLKELLYIQSSTEKDLTHEETIYGSSAPSAREEIT